MEGTAEIAGTAAVEMLWKARKIYSLKNKINFFSKMNYYEYNLTLYTSRIIDNYFMIRDVS
jgi:hypothetical protein